MPRINSLQSVSTTSFLNRRAAIAQLLYTISSDATDVDISTLFSAADWASTVAKKVVINSGVTVGATSTSNAAITTGTGNGGTLEIVNNGTILGKGGSGGASVSAPSSSASSGNVAVNNGSDGGAAIEAQVDCTIVNNGDCYGGGGGGGSGGYGSTLRNYQYSVPSTVYQCGGCSNLPSFYCQYYGYSYGYCTTYYYYTRLGVNGGSGGAGGAGAGYGLATGQAGSSGTSGSSTTNHNGSSATSGNGGAGGAGGNYGTDGSAGSSGQAYSGTWYGSWSSASGAVGGSAGASLSNPTSKTVTVTNNGNMNGY